MSLQIELLNKLFSGEPGEIPVDAGPTLTNVRGLTLQNVVDNACDFFASIEREGVHFSCLQDAWSHRWTVRKMFRGSGVDIDISLYRNPEGGYAIEHTANTGDKPFGTDLFGAFAAHLGGRIQPSLIPHFGQDAGGCGGCESEGDVSDLIDLAAYDLELACSTVTPDNAFRDAKMFAQGLETLHRIIPRGLGINEQWASIIEGLGEIFDPVSNQSIHLNKRQKQMICDNPDSVFNGEISTILTLWSRDQMNDMRLQFVVIALGDLVECGPAYRSAIMRLDWIGNLFRILVKGINSAPDHRTEILRRTSVKILDSLLEDPAAITCSGLSAAQIMGPNVLARYAENDFVQMVRALNQDPEPDLK